MLLEIIPPLTGDWTLPYLGPLTSPQALSTPPLTTSIENGMGWRINLPMKRQMVEMKPFFIQSSVHLNYIAILINNLLTSL